MRWRGRRPGRPLAGAASACLLALAVAACGGGGEAGPPTSAVVAANPVTVTVTEVETVTVTAPAEATEAGPGTARGEPTTEDVAAIGAAVSEVVAQCEAVAAGYVEEPERDTLERQVGVLADAAGRFDVGTAFTVGGATEVAGPTTLRAQLDLAARHLRAGCAPDLASRLRTGG